MSNSKDTYVEQHAEQCDNETTQHKLQHEIGFDTWEVVSFDDVREYEQELKHISCVSKSEVDEQDQQSTLTLSVFHSADETTEQRSSTMSLLTPSQLTLYQHKRDIVALTDIQQYDKDMYTALQQCSCEELRHIAEYNKHECEVIQQVIVNRAKIAFNIWHTLNYVVNLMTSQPGATFDQVNYELAKTRLALNSDEIIFNVSTYVAVEIFLQTLSVDKLNALMVSMEQLCDMIMLVVAQRNPELALIKKIQCFIEENCVVNVQDALVKSMFIELGRNINTYREEMELNINRRHDLMRFMYGVQLEMLLLLNEYIKTMHSVACKVSSKH